MPESLSPFFKEPKYYGFFFVCAIIYKMFVSYLIKSKFIVFPLKAHATHRVVSGTGQTREQGNNTQTCILEGGGARLAP